MGIVRKTKSVKAILELFESTEVALSSVDLVERLDNKMNKTTVYRILDRLQDEGALHSFLDKNGLKWYAKCQGCSSNHHEDKHPHFQCRDCGKTTCLSLNISIPAISNHKIDNVEFLLTGQCEDCLS